MYRPQTVVPQGGAQVPRSPVLKRDTVGTFEARLRWSNRVRWLAPLAAVGVLVAVAAVWALASRRGDAGAERARAEAVALLARDDGASLDEAVARLGAVVNKRPKLRAAAADRALALVVRAAWTAEEAEALSGRVAELRDQRERARREQGPGWQEVERTASVEASRLEPEIRAREERTRALSSGARDQLNILHSEVGETPEVLRALALLHALSGERDRLHREVRVAREAGQRDAWIDLADGWGDARDPDRAARERSLVKLGALAAARPDLLRGRFLLARAELSLGRKAEALAAAEGVLVANPAHEGARRLKDELATRPAPAPPAPQAAAASSQAAAPAANAEPRRKKRVSHPVAEPSAKAPESPPPAPTPDEAPPSIPEPVPAPLPATAPPPATPAPAPPAPTPPPARQKFEVTPYWGTEAG